MSFPVVWTPWESIPLAIVAGYLLPKLYRLLVGLFR